MTSKNKHIAKTALSELGAYAGHDNSSIHVCEGSHKNSIHSNNYIKKLLRPLRVDGRINKIVKKISVRHTQINLLIQVLHSVRFACDRLHPHNLPPSLQRSVAGVRVKYKNNLVAIGLRLLEAANATSRSLCYVFLMIGWRSPPPCADIFILPATWFLMHGPASFIDTLPSSISSSDEKSDTHNVKCRFFGGTTCSVHRMGPL